MIPAAFDYVRPQTLEEAIAALASNEDAKILAGGHSLLPAMKLRLAQPRTLIDIGRLRDLNYIRRNGDRIAIGATTTHGEIENSELLKEACPLLPEVAATIGDAQVRNRGTLGGSVVHADPAADWPGAMMALDAEMEIAGPDGRRSVPVADFFVQMMQSAVQANEVLVEIRVPVTARSVAYAKFAQRASGFAIVGVAAVVDKEGKSVRVGVTGATPKAFRATGVEEALRGKTLTPELIREASAQADEGIETLHDLHASAAYRAHLVRVYTTRALEQANSRD
jgi:carbon-monoxide dehydrogenase medium subunit